MRYATSGVVLKTGEVATVEVAAASAAAVLKAKAPPAPGNGGSPANDDHAPASDGAANGSSPSPSSSPAPSSGPAPSSVPASPVDGFPAVFKQVFAKILASPIFKDLSDDDLNGLYTPEQQALVKDFADTKHIPPHLFHGKLGKATLQQRIVMSGVILATGRLQNGRPGDEPGEGQGKPRATCCGHFAHWIWHYAGANPAGKSAHINQDYPSSVTGAAGGLFFGGAKYTAVSFNRRSGNYQLQPGDWLYICYDKKDDPEWKFTSMGDHSVIFSHWESPGNGVFFSQRFNQDQAKGYPKWSKCGGADQHGATVFPGKQDAFYYVSLIMRPDDSSFNLLRTVDETKAVKKNRAWLDKNQIDADKLHPILVKQARERLGIVSDRQKLTDFLNTADVESKKSPEDAAKYRLQDRVCLSKDEAYKPISPEQAGTIKKIIDDAEQARGSTDETLLSITRLYALNQRMRLRWDSDGAGFGQSVDGMLESDYTWPGGHRKAVVWELLGFADKKAATGALWA